MKVRDPVGQSKSHPCVEICVLAGGLSARMGRDKSRLRLGPRTFVGHLRHLARSARIPFRVIRRDLVSRSGPLGGIFTGLKTTRARTVLFLACDMPLMTEKFLRKLIRKLPARMDALAVSQRDRIGFPILIRRSALPLVARQLQKQQRSLHSLFQQPRMTFFVAPPSDELALFNINTPDNLEKARSSLRGRA